MGALILRRNRILLVKRARDPLKGYWSLPGGVLELGERLEDAVRREVLEETGLTVRPTTLLEVFERITPGKQQNPEYHYVLIDYVCKVTGGELRPASDVSDVAWVRQQDLGDYRLTGGTLPVIEKAFQLRSTK